MKVSLNHNFLRREGAIALVFVLLFLPIFARNSSAAHISMPAASWVYLPLIIQQPTATPGDCAGNALVNGNFEMGETGWYTATLGPWTQFKPHLILPGSEGNTTYLGHYSAYLGGYEGTWDAITQTVTIPPQAQLTYWWKIGSYETLPNHDYFRASFLNQEGESVVDLALHTDVDELPTWSQDVLDVSAFAGETLTLSFSSSNDNYYFTSFLLDEVCLRTRVGSHE